MWRALATSSIILHHHNSLKLRWLLLFSKKQLSSLLSKDYRQTMCCCGDLLPFSWNAGWMKTFLMPSSKYRTLNIKQKFLFFLQTPLSLPLFFFQQPFFPMHEDTIIVNHSNTPLKLMIFDSVCCSPLLRAYISPPFLMTITLPTFTTLDQPL